MAFYKNVYRKGDRPRYALDPGALHRYPRGEGWKRIIPFTLKAVEGPENAEWLRALKLLKHKEAA